MARDSERRETPLPGTLTFVLVMGLCFLAGWFALFLLMAARW
jgi:hypothetical protein